MKIKQGSAVRCSQVSLSLSLSGGFVCLLFLVPVWACGTVEGWISVYEQGEKHKALFHLLDCADNYVAPSDDLALLPVIKDGLGRDSETASLSTGVFVHFNHLWGARHEPAYADVFKSITGLNDIQTLSKYNGWMVVTPNRGANMRANPSVNSLMITSVKFGMQVKNISKKGEWILVRLVGPGSGDPRFERKEGYIHESLLAPY